jgi:hypothetical protein
MNTFFAILDYVFFVTVSGISGLKVKEKRKKLVDRESFIELKKRKRDAGDCNDKKWNASYRLLRSSVIQVSLEFPIFYEKQQLEKKTVKKRIVAKK